MKLIVVLERWRELGWDDFFYHMRRRSRIIILFFLIFRSFPAIFQRIERARLSRNAPNADRAAPPVFFSEIFQYNIVKSPSDGKNVEEAPGFWTELLPCVLFFYSGKQK